MSETVESLQVLFDGADVTDKINLAEGPIQVVSALNEELDTATLALKDAGGLGIIGWEDVQILDGADKQFGGYAINPNMQPDTKLTKNRAVIGASDYGAYLGKVYIQAEYTDMSDKEMLAAVWAACPDLADYDFSSCVTAVRSIPRAVFNLRSVRDVITWLCEQSGAYWYVDYDKCLHYFGSAQSEAPFGVTNDPTDTANCLCENFSIDNDAGAVVNIVEVVGGKALSVNATFPATQIGYNTIIYLSRRYRAWEGASKIAVRRNDGGPTTNLIVNPSFETNITDGWTQYQAGTGGTWTQDATKFSVGTKSLKVKAGTAVTVLQGQAISLAPGETLTVQSRVWCGTAGKAAVVIWDIGNGVNRGECYNRKTSEWELVTAGYYNSTGTTLSVRVELYNNANDGTTVAYYDAVQAEKLAWPSAYCDGTLGTGYAWTGTAHNSTSTRVNMPVWTTLTVKTGNSDMLEGRDEVLYFDSDSHLEQETFWPTLTNGIEIDGREEKPVHVIVRNQTSYELYGKWLKAVITDTSIVDPRVAVIRASTELAQNALTRQTISFKVRRPGLRAGQNIAIHMPHRGVDGDYLINRVTSNIGIAGFVEADVEVGAIDADLVTLWMRLKRASQISNADINDDQVINQILDALDKVYLNKGTVSVSESNGPYNWGSADWGYSTWG
jgi:hypothetical protein